MLVAFISGLLVECLGVLWVHFAERNMRTSFLLISITQGTAYILGIGAAIVSGLAAVAFVVGFGVGSLAGLWVKKRLS